MTTRDISVRVVLDQVGQIIIPPIPIATFNKLLAIVGNQPPRPSWPVYQAMMDTFVRNLPAKINNYQTKWAQHEFGLDIWFRVLTNPEFGTIVRSETLMAMQADWPHICLTWWIRDAGNHMVTIAHDFEQDVDFDEVQIH